VYMCVASSRLYMEDIFYFGVLAFDPWLVGTCLVFVFNFN